MEANKVTIPNIFNNSRLLEIPFYQRSYVWGEDEWQRLLEDMEYVTAKKEKYFLGSIILKAYTGPTSQAISEHRIVIDGQQRLTTLMIFFKVLCLKMGRNDYFERDFVLEDGQLALAHGRNDVAAFEEAMAAVKAEPILSDRDNIPQITKAFNWFVEHLNPETVSRPEIKTNVQFVCIDLNSEDDEQQIFDTINSLGVRLTTAELLKNYLFNRENVEEYESNWVEVFEKDDDTRAYWDTTVKAGSYEYTLIELFFNALLQIKARDGSYDVSNEDRQMFNRSEQLFSSYKLFIGEYMNGDKHAFLLEMKKYAQLFFDFFDLEQCEEAMPAESGMERINVLAFGMKNLTIIPYVLYLLHEQPDERIRTDIFEALESYLMRRTVVRANNRSYGLFFLALIQRHVLTREQFAQQIEEQSGQNVYFPDDDELRDAFKTSRLTNKNAAGVLYFIESKIHPADSSTALLGFNTYSLEHMMPKKWRNKWHDIEPDSDEAYARDKTLLTLGNLAIVTQPLNSAMCEKTWKDKLAGTAKKPGLAECAAGLTTMHGALNLEKWDEGSIAKRADALAEDAIKTWPTI